ncbi:putative reverse transcriptase domain-containing protein, partial [Tanacetum coccineum]
LSRLVPHLVTPENKRIEMYIYGLAPQICGMVAAMKPETIQKVMQKGEPGRDRNVRDDNKRTRTRNAFATTANPMRREYLGTTPKCTNCNLHHTPESLYRACFNYNHLGHLAKDCRVGPRMVNSVNARNPTAAHGTCFECSGHGNNDNWACGGAFMLGIEEAHQDPNIMTGTFTLNNHYATILFDSGADYRFVSTIFTPLLGKETSNLGFNYEIKIASGQLVEINKVIRGYKPEIEWYTFDNDLIPFGSRSFDMIVGMDWLFKHKAEIICHEKVVRIPLRNGKTHRFIGENLKEKLRLNFTYNQEPSRDRNVRDDTKRTRTRNAFPTTANSVRREVGPRMIKSVNARNPTAARGTCFECGGTDHFKATCPRLNQEQRPGGEEARHDPNIMMGTFTLNNHYATTLFDSGANYRFVSTVFTPLLGIETSNLGFSYEIEIASGQLVEINKVIRGYKLEIEWYTFDIDLIPFRSGSFDVVVEMDWLSKHKDEILFYEKVVRILLWNGKTHRFIGEKPKEKVRYLITPCKF